MQRAATCRHGMVEYLQQYQGRRLPNAEIEFLISLTAKLDPADKKEIV